MVQEAVEMQDEKGKEAAQAQDVLHGGSASTNSFAIWPNNEERFPKGGFRFPISS
eukprot:CAMPEP_0195033002 /NCGR_PEP_ID=MMETSP0326_2-20130528/64679_1 /TAXON_ID=2866 ORGANISM="Crypthecodinium cohnii, Strain Seligo" /NCGR_SAMPLE_ID=MMETSP0326_2 /ASSEMBLY_ACC=CAM_ASM_000348 /LENGTH=54 /DNA_ID=CAMNT_0040057299 /DNA_START=1 /DNA_END=166 /DNA_ORIENTATION=+